MGFCRVMISYWNELIFSIQLILIGVFLFYFFKKKYADILLQLLLYILIFLNIMSNYEVMLFGLHCSVVEPLGIIAYFISIYLYSWKYDGIDRMFKNIYIINIFICGLLYAMSLYHVSFNAIYMKNFVANYIWNTIISLISFKIAYVIERHFYNNVFEKVGDLYRQSLSVVVSQLFDTVFYTILVFYSRPFSVICSIIFFSYVIKILCISFYTIVLQRGNLIKK